MHEALIIYPSLYNTTYYSFLDSHLSIDDLISHALTYKHRSVVISDHKYLYGYMEFYHKAKAANLKPIFGLTYDYQECELLLIAQNQTGYTNLIKISSHETIDPNWFHDLFIIVLSGNFNLNINQVFYANVEHPQGVYIHQKLFKTKDDYQVYCALKAIKYNGNRTNAKIMLDDCLASEVLHQNAYLDYPCSLSPDNVQIKNLLKIIDQCEEYSLPKQDQIIKYPIKESISASDYLKSLAFLGLKGLANQDSTVQLNLGKYLERINYEWSVINQLAFADYFLIVYDFVQYARKNRILVGPGRGSAASSLIAYCLGITQVDPIKYGLYFERFLNPGRNSMPDIDIDFMDTRREEVVHYLFHKYTKDHVAQIITFQRWKARGAIRDIGRILGIDLKIIDQICKKIPLNYEGSLFDLQDNSYLKNAINAYSDLFLLAEKIIGAPRQIGLHAAGIVLSNAQLGTNFPVIKTSDGLTYTQFSMEYLEELGLLKIDLLGLKNLTTIVNIVNLIDQNHQKEIWIEDLSFDDRAIFQQLTSGDTFGIFQLESPGMTKLLKRLKPQNLEDIALTTSLYRPGPLKQIDDFLKIRHGMKKYVSLNPKLDEILAPTHGVIVYQEQVISVVKKVMNCSASEADLFRRAISKKDEQLLFKLKNQFVTKAIANNYNDREVDQIWNYVYEFANYGFNHPHAIAYSMISYWLAWLKFYYPLEFYCAFLKSFIRPVETMEMARIRGIVCRGPNVNQAVDFSISNNTIYFGLITIKGLGLETIKKISQTKESYPQKLFTDLVTTICHFYQQGITKNTILLLNHAGYFDCLFKEQENRKFIDDNFDKIIANNLKVTKDNLPLFILKYQYQPYDQKLIDYYVELETQLIGYSFLKNDWLRNQIEPINAVTTKVIDIPQQTEPLVEYVVRIIEVRETKTRYNKLMAWVKLADETGVSSALPYFGSELSLLVSAQHDNSLCRIVIEHKNNNFRIKSVIPYESK